MFKKFIYTLILTTFWSYSFGSDYKSVLNEAEELFEMKKYEQANIKFNEAVNLIDIQSDAKYLMPEIHYKIGKSFCYLKEFKSADTHFDKALTLSEEYIKDFEGENFVFEAYTKLSRTMYFTLDACKNKEFSS